MLYKGIYQGHIKKLTIILKVVALQALLLWLIFFDKQMSHDDINVLQRSLLFSRLTERQAPPCNYTVNGHDYNMGAI